MIPHLARCCISIFFGAYGQRVLLQAVNTVFIFTTPGTSRLTFLLITIVFITCHNLQSQFRHDNKWIPIFSKQLIATIIYLNNNVNRYI